MEEEQLSDKVLKMMRQLGDMPLLDTRVYKSKDGKYIINEVRIKTIKPVNYYNAIIENKGTEFPYGADAKRGDKNGRSY